MAFQLQSTYVWYMYSLIITLMRQMALQLYRRKILTQLYQVPSTSYSWRVPPGSYLALTLLLPWACVPFDFVLPNTPESTRRYQVQYQVVSHGANLEGSTIIYNHQQPPSGPY